MTLSAGMRELEELSLELCSDICALRYLARASFSFVACPALHCVPQSITQRCTACVPRCTRASSPVPVRWCPVVQSLSDARVRSAETWDVLILWSRAMPGRPDEAEAAQSGLVWAP